MPTPLDFVTKGKVLDVRDGAVVFAPAGGNYELRLKSAGAAADSFPQNTPVHVRLRGEARKMWTVPTGGNFITPITGTPRILQGWVLWADDKTVVIDAGAKFIVTLPAADTAVDLTEGAVAVGQRVNCTLLPGASIEPVVAQSPAVSVA